MSASGSKICFNHDCGVAESERWRKGWRLRSGEIADLCDRCGSAYEEMRFCEAFHSDATGWRSCESCGKRLHCGCVASVHTFVLLDTGGVECMACARKGSLIMASNQIWPSSLFLPLPLPERLIDLSVKNWSQITGTSSGSGQWRQAPNLWHAANGHSELYPWMHYPDVDRSNSIDKPISGDRSSASAQDKKNFEDLPERKTSTCLKFGAVDELVKGNIGADNGTALSTFNREEESIKGFQDSSHLTGGTDPPDPRTGAVAEYDVVSRMNCETRSNSCVDVSLQPSTSKDDSSTPLFGLAVSVASPAGTNDPAKVSGSQTQRKTSPPLFSKPLYPSPLAGLDSSGELHPQNRAVRPRGEVRGRNQLLPRYWPRISDQELQQISGDSNSVVTPLFEKMLSASDAGRIGRLVLPKKCAEAYFPAISQPEGLPLKVQDAKGKDWVFQFRFWPNNNSRMYVLEGVTPCIQSMQLQAGDTVTFSRIEPEGKLVMGFRKASSIPSEQAISQLKNGNGVSPNEEVNNGSTKPSEVMSSLSLHPYKGSTESTSYASITQVNPAYSWAKHDKSGCMPREGSSAKFPLLPHKRKNSTLGSKSKRLRIDNEDSIELKLTWEEAQDLLRPPPNHVPTIVVIEGHEFEEYEEAPVLGKPTVFTTNHAGEKNQWAQCGDCFKWRKMPVDALLPPRWTCSDNSWDPKRSSCSSAQELSTEQLEDLLFPNTGERKGTEVAEELKAVEAGLDTLANLAILAENEPLTPLTQATTKHPRHRPGCTCIVCIQPPSGKGPKHKQTCTCNVCLTVKRRFRTLMMRREKRLSEKEAETTRKKQHQDSPIKVEDEELKVDTSERSDENPRKKKLNPATAVVADTASPSEDDWDGRKSSPARRSGDLARSPSESPFKGQIDLNSQPEREEEPTPVLETDSLAMLFRDSTQRYFKPQVVVASSVCDGEPAANPVEMSGNGRARDDISSGPHNGEQQNVDNDLPNAGSVSALASTSVIG